MSYPPANGESQGNYCQLKSLKLAVFEEKQKNNKKRLFKTALTAKHANFFSNGFWFWFDEKSK